MRRVVIDVEVGDLRVAFEGGRGFYERWVEPLVEGAYRRASATAPEGAATAPGATQGPTGPSPAGTDLGARGATHGTPAASSAATGPAPAPSAPPADTWRPASPGHFQQFVAQVGDRASSPDKRVMAFAFYLWNYEKRESFATSEVERFFRTVLDEPTEGLADLLEDLSATRGFLEAEGPAGPWALRKKGVGFVKARLLGQF
jgi:hypothetical protein